MPTENAMPCEHCGMEVDFVTEVSALGREPGHRVYFCDSCQRSTWITWPPVLQTPPQIGRPQQQQQQQQQPKKDDDEKK